MKKNPLILILFSLSFLVLITISSCNTATTQLAKPAMPEKPKTETFVLRKEQLSSNLHVPGEIKADREVEVYAKVNSYVKDLRVDVGSEVKAGQLLIVLEAPEISTQLAGTRSKYNSQKAVYVATKASYDRLVEASKTEGAISKDALDQMIAKKDSDWALLQAAKAAYEESKVMQEYLELRAPFSGVVTSRSIDLGAYVGPSGKGSQNPLLTIQAQSKLRLVVYVPEANLPYLNDKNAVTFKVRSIPEKQFTGQIARRSAALDARLRSERIEIDIPNNSQELIPGMVAEVDIPLASEGSRLVVPMSAVLESDEGIFVIKAEENKAKRIAVKKGLKREDKVEVFGDLQAGDVLVTKANAQLSNGTPIVN
jgi:membrane fusion protein, multidrug efflux system